VGASGICHTCIKLQLISAPEKLRQVSAIETELAGYIERGATAGVGDLVGKRRDAPARCAGIHDIECEICVPNVVRWPSHGVRRHRTWTPSGNRKPPSGRQLDADATVSGRITGSTQSTVVAGL